MEKLPPIKIDEKTFLRQHCSLPSLPEVVTKIQEEIHSDGVNIANVAAIVADDPALIAQILKVVNSAYYGLSKEIIDIKFAIAYLGLNEVSRIVLSISVVNSLSITEESELNKFWFHSFFTALCCKHLAKRIEPLLSFDELWPAAILHDIGKLVYLKFFPNHYRKLVKYTEENQCLFSDAERYYSVPTSSYFGALLCDRWRLPEKVREACEFHGLNDLLKMNTNGGADGFRRIICLGNLIANLSADTLNKNIKNELIQFIQQDIGFSEDNFLLFMGEIYELKLNVEKLYS